MISYAILIIIRSLGRCRIIPLYCFKAPYLIDCKSFSGMTNHLYRHKYRQKTTLLENLALFPELSGMHFHDWLINRRNSFCRQSAFMHRGRAINADHDLADHLAPILLPPHAPTRQEPYATVACCGGAQHQQQEGSFPSGGVMIPLGPKKGAFSDSRDSWRLTGSAM